MGLEATEGLKKRIISYTEHTKGKLGFTVGFGGGRFSGLGLGYRVVGTHYSNPKGPRTQILGF